MTEYEKLWAAVSSAPANTDFPTLMKLMKSAGFEMRMGRKQHAIFTNRRYGKLQNVARPHHGPVKPVYVRECLKTIEEIQVLQGKIDD